MNESNFKCVVSVFVLGGLMHAMIESIFTQVVSESDKMFWFAGRLCS